MTHNQPVHRIATSLTLMATGDRHRSLKTMNDYVTKKKLEMIARLEEYLAGRLTHDEVREFAWDIVEKSPQPAPPDEETFWSTAFAVVHVADAGHWKDGVTQRDLRQMLELLKTDNPIPPKWKKK